MLEFISWKGKNYKEDVHHHCLRLEECDYFTWPKNTSKKENVLERGKQGPYIDKYFLKSQYSQSNEVQWPDSPQSSQDISPSEEEECMVLVQPKPGNERKTSGDKPLVKWPGASEKKQ